MEIKIATDLVAKSTELSAKFVNGMVSPDAIVAVLDGNNGTISTITDVRTETDEDTGQQTIWLVTEEN